MGRYDFDPFGQTETYMRGRDRVAHAWRLEQLARGASVRRHRDDPGVTAPRQVPEPRLPLWLRRPHEGVD
jgi:hypothetical protein